ncbi:MBL fold metallo-hydrolase [Herbaspirillum sp. meg3]|uniref:MBL fold metallo-hydrolase n=1 Tax=Herbaspirillum sp. meg3 TaxID=2025949 RepID=UPI000B99CAD8|nr:MBL fold metallo-hydrolase [Herbaspirillum sp. meg3]ASU36928.1 MBL fold metallo-hydrolase [Herbaspirillum sp. meg3]
MRPRPYGLPSSVYVLERGWLSSNNVLFLGAEETALVDTGYVTHAAQTLALVEHVLNEQGRAPQLDRVINTHLHSDHCGGNAALQARYRCRTTIPHAEADKVARWDEDALSYRETGQQCPRFRFDDTLQDGDTLPLGDLAWTALAAPGHDPHSLILYCAQEGILISADALWQNGFGVIFPELDGESGFAEARATLDLIAGLDVRVVIPGHGAPFTEVKQALATAYSRLDYLQADPLRNAQNSVKVMLKFLLLERQAIPLHDVASMMADIPLLARCNHRYFQLSDDALADWASTQLIKAGAASSDGVTLHNAG